MINITRQETLRQFVEREVFVCQSSLVEEAFNREFFLWDDVINLYRPFDGRLLTPNVCCKCRHKFDCLDSETGECETCFSENQQTQEVYEWWIVSDWLELKLKLQGEPILSNQYGTWWGRCCTGQAIFLDDVIERIHDEMTQ